MIVVDAAAVVDALLAAPGSEAIAARLGRDELHAPALLDAEMVSVARGLTLGSHISAARAGDVLTDFDDLPIERWSFSEPFRRRAFDLRDNISAYDAAYVALAEALGCVLITRDARLARSVGHDARIELL